MAAILTICPWWSYSQLLGAIILWWSSHIAIPPTLCPGSKQFRHHHVPGVGSHGAKIRWSCNEMPCICAAHHLFHGFATSFLDATLQWSWIPASHAARSQLRRSEQFQLIWFLTFLVGHRLHLESLAQQVYHALGIWHTKHHDYRVGCKSANSACTDESWVMSPVMSVLRRWVCCPSEVAKPCGWRSTATRHSCEVWVQPIHYRDMFPSSGFKWCKQCSGGLRFNPQPALTVTGSDGAPVAGVTWQ